MRALILTPTRELAAQVEESVRDYGKYKKSTVAVIFGGVSINNQIAALKRGVDIVVATPGRLLDHAGQKTIDLSQVEVLVLDEADRMLDMGFLPDMKRVFAHAAEAAADAAVLGDVLRRDPRAREHPAEGPGGRPGDAAQLRRRSGEPEGGPRSTAAASRNCSPS